MREGSGWLLVGNIAPMDVDQLGPDALADLRRVVDGRWAVVRAEVREQLAEVGAGQVDVVEVGHGADVSDTRRLPAGEP